MIRSALLALIFALGCLGSQSFGQASSPLGLPTKVTDLYIPGPLVEVIPRQDLSSSLVVRILEVKPADEGHRYDLEIYGLDPGTHQIGKFLRYQNEPDRELPLESTVEITTIHPTDTLPDPSELSPTPPDRLGGYRTLIIVLGVLWLLVFLAILFYRKKEVVDETQVIPEPTLHEKLGKLVGAASRGELDDNERAHLERLILGHYREDLGDIPPSRALAKLRHHPEASPLVLKLEEWLHSPNPNLSREDVLPLLEPFQNQPE